MKTQEKNYDLSAFVQDITEIVENTERDAEQVKQAEKHLNILIRNTEWLPLEILENDDESNYARHSLYRDPHDRFEVLALIWKPGQSTPLHDHDGTWGVEGVIKGRMKVKNYLQLESLPNHITKLCYTNSMTINEQSTGELLPPADCHILNAEGESTAVTIHVYGKQLKEFRVFEPLEDNEGYYVGNKVAVGYTSEKEL